MSILRTLTEAESDLAAKESLVLQVGEATHHLAVTLAAASDRFWSLPTDRLLAVLNADVSSSAATLTANADLAEVVNASLDALGTTQFPTRAPLTGRSDITFDGTAFVLIAPIVSLEAPTEAEAEPVPEPVTEPVTEP
jgi:hypothetical protein